LPGSQLLSSAGVGSGFCPSKAVPAAAAAVDDDGDGAEDGARDGGWRRSHACDAATTIRTATNMHSGAWPVENMKNVKQKSGKNFSNLKLPTKKKECQK